MVRPEGLNPFITGFDSAHRLALRIVAHHARWV
jgi:hypothetical protein